MKESRTNKLIKNTTTSLMEQGVYTVMTFICRTVFIYTLGKTYLGFSGLFNDILTLLSLAELGVGTAILYSMYKPAAQNDYETLGALLNLYKRVYHSIGVVITILGLCLAPCLDFFISDIPEIPKLPVIYILYLLNTTSSYFFVYKKSILIVTQRSYIASLIYIGLITLQNVLQIIFLLFTQNYIAYLIIQVTCSLLNNILISIYVDNNYPELVYYKNARLDKEATKEIFANVRAMFLSKISSAIVTSTDNLLISKFVSTIILGLYSNYTLFVTMIRTIMTKIFQALVGSVGNLIALEDKEKVYSVFKKIWFVNFWIVAFMTTTLFTLVNSFIELWIGETYILEMEIVFVVCFNLYMRLIRNTFITFIDAFGLFKELKLKCIAEAIINLVVSLVFVLPLEMGIYGVLLGTIVSNLATNFWYEPYLLFCKKFGVSFIEYMKYFAKYFIVTTVGATVVFYISNYLLVIQGLGGFILKGIICCLFLNLFYFVVFRKSEEFDYVLSLIVGRIKRKHHQ